MFAPLRAQFPALRSYDRGEDRHAAVAAASIVAKDERDRRFAAIAARYRAVGDDAGAARGAGDEHDRALALEQVELAQLDARVDLVGLDHAHRHVRRARPHQRGQRGPARDRVLAAHLLGVAHAGPGQRAGGAGVERDRGHDHRPEDGAAAGLVEAQRERAPGRGADPGQAELVVPGHGANRAASSSSARSSPTSSS